MPKEQVQIDLVVNGHVDSGTYTSIDHQRTNENFEKEGAETSKASFMYVWVIEEMKAERERGIAIDIALYQYQSDKHLITIIDALSHTSFRRNITTNTSQTTNAAVPMITNDASGSEFGFSKDGQTTEHTLLA